MRLQHLLSALALCLASSGAVAHDISDVLKVGTFKSTTNNPRGLWVSNSIRGTVDLIDPLSLRLAIDYTFNAKQPPSDGASFPTSASHSLGGGAGLDWTISDHWGLSLDLSGTGSFKSTTSTTISFDTKLPNASGEIEGQLESRSWNAGASLSGYYDTAGDSKWENTITLGFDFNWVQSTQKINQAVDPKTGKPFDLAQVKTDCADPTSKKCPKFLKTVLQESSAGVGEMDVMVDWTQTFIQMIDWSINGAYYFYTQDPSALGYYSIAKQGAPTMNFGGGIPVSPMLFSVGTGIGVTYSGFRSDVDFSYGQYREDSTGSTSFSIGVGLKLRYDINDHWRVWVTGSWQQDRDSQIATSNSGSGGAGVRYTF